MKWGTRLLSAALVVAAAGTQVHAASVGVTVNGMDTTLNPLAMSANYTGVISFTSDSATSLGLGGLNPLFAGFMGTGITISGSLNFLSGALDTSMTNSLTIDAGNGDLMTLGFGLPAKLTALPLNSFNLAVTVTSASLTDGNNDGKFGTITLPYVGYSFSGAGGADALGQDYTFTLFRKTDTLDDGSISAGLTSTNGDPSNGDTTPAAPLPASAVGGMSLLATLGAGRMWRKRRA